MSTLSILGLMILGFLAVALVLLVLNALGTVLYWKIISFFFKKDIQELLQTKLNNRSRK